MDIDKLTLMINNSISMLGFGSPMDIDKLTHIFDLYEELRCFGSLMDIVYAGNRNRSAAGRNGIHGGSISGLHEY